MPSRIERVFVNWKRFGVRWTTRAFDRPVAQLSVMIGHTLHRFEFRNFYTRIDLDG